MANVSSSNGLEKRPKLRFPGFDEPWKEIKIGDIFKVTRGNVLSSALVSSEKSNGYTYPVFSSQTKDDGLMGYYNEFLFEDAITWTTDGANAGTVHFRKGKFYCTNVCGVLLNSYGYANRCIAEILGRVSKRYVSYVGNPKLMNNVMSEICIYIPSLAEQSHIDDFLLVLDKKIEKQRQLVDSLKKYKRGLISDLFCEKSTQGWTTSRYYFSEIAQRRGEKYDPSSGIEYPCVELENIEQETGKILATVPSIEQGSIKNIAKSGDTLFGKLRPYLRKYAFAQQTMACSSEIWALIPSDVVLPKFLFYLVQTEQFLRVANISSGTKMPRAEWSNIEKAEFYIPDLPVQRKVVSFLEGMDRRIAFTDSMLICLNRLKASLLQQLFI